VIETPYYLVDEARLLGNLEKVARVRERSGARAFAPPWTMSGSGVRAVRPAPAQGEHTREILREAGYDDPAVDRLAADGSVRGA